MSDLVLLTDKKSAFLRIPEHLAAYFTEAIRTGITEFFKNHPNFDIREESVQAAAGLDVDQEVIKALCDMQRTLPLASNRKEFHVLMTSGLTSAFKIASMSVEQLTAKARATTAHSDSPIYVFSAEDIHARATAISNRNQSLLTAMYQASRGTGIAAIDGPGSDIGRSKMLGSVGGNPVMNVNLEELFGVMDGDSCDDCNSVTSPAAYFVDILQFLRINNLDSETTQETVLDRLFARRPDLGDLQLTCPNTTAILPYIDLANEVMESFVVHLNEQSPGDGETIGKATLDVHNSDGTSGELLSEPQHTNFSAYSILSTQLYPFHRLPYNQALDEARTFLKHLGTSRYELLETCYPGPTPNPRAGSANIDLDKENVAMIAEYLNLTAEEYSALIVEKTDMEYEYWGYRSDNDLLSTDESTHTGLMFIKAQFLSRSGMQFSDLVDLLKTEYINPMAEFAARNPIIILHTSEEDMRYRLIRSTGDPLTISDYQRIRQFIQLWHRIGWTIDEIDKVICSRSKPDQPALITSDVLEQLVAVLKLLEITKLERSMLLTFWSPISMQGDNSPYSRLFLTSGATRADPVLQLDEHGYILSSASISEHEPLVMATIGLTKAGLDAIRANLEKGTYSTSRPTNDILSLENLSFLYRHGLMAKFLHVTPTVLFDVIEIFGNPFGSPTDCLQFVGLWKRMGDMGFTFPQLHYLVKGVDDPTNPLALSEKKIEEMMKFLLEGSALHPKKAEPGADHSTTATASSIDKLQIIGKLGTDLVVTTVSKVLGLTIETTKALLTGIKIKTTDALMIVISVIDFEMAMQSEHGAMKREEAAVAVERTAAGEAVAKEAMGEAEKALERAERYTEEGSRLAADAVEEAVKRGEGIETAVESMREYTRVTDRALMIAKQTKDEAEEALKRAEVAAEEAVREVEALQRAEGAAGKAVREEEAVEHAGVSLKSLLTKVARASIFISGFKLSTDEVICVLANEAGFQGFAEGELSLDGWKTVLAYSELRDSLPKGVDATLLELLKWLSPMHRAQAGSAEEKVKKIIDLMLIPQETVTFLTDHFSSLPGFNCYPDVAVLTMLKKTSDFAKKLSIDAASLLSWASPLADFEHTHRVAQAIRGSIRARFTKEDWGKIVKPLQDQLRQNKRDALIAHLLVQPKLIQWGVIDADSLFEFFMIDVQMGPLFETSRIKQAISTVQVFVQRCFSGLEERYGVPNHKLNDKRWEWMKNYRMWEANRKVFLYPENWIEPSLRDDQSPFFLEFEADVAKKNLDTKNMQDAVKNYISRVDEVANLLPVAFFVDKSEAVDGLPKTEVVHLFAKTRSAPYIYYYRPYDEVKKRWKPWEQMDVEIQHHVDPQAVNHGGEFFIPGVIGGRLIVFTPQITRQVKKGAKAPVKDRPLETVHYFEIKLGWSEYRNGKWTPKRLSSEAIRWKSRESVCYNGQSGSTIDPDYGLGGQSGSTIDPGFGRIGLDKDDRIDFNRDVSHFRFSVRKSGTSGADIDVSLGEEVGKFEFRGTSCTVTGNKDWGTRSTEQVADTMTEYDDIIEEIRAGEGTRAMWVFNMDQESLTATSNSWTLLPQKPTLAPPLDVTEILLKYDSAALLLTHTDSSATLDDLYNHLHDLGKQPTSVEIPLNELATPFGLYEWELGVHVPMLLIDKLTGAQQYEKALEIARFVFNPLASSENDSSLLRVWKWAPFRKIVDSKRDETVNNWRNEPFNPHVIARDRPIAYMTWMVMRYITILIAAGDQLFRRATMESMPLAIQYYTMAAHLYGPPIRDIPKHTKKNPETFNNLFNKWDAFSNAMVTFENEFPFSNSVGSDQGTANTGFTMTYFCVPRNPAIRDLRTQIDDRLFKIRHCQDINGVTRKLALWEPSIDPGALVRAAAAGLSLSSVMDSISGPMPNYRFQYLLRGALELIQELKSLAGAFLNAKEKMDSEAYQRIRTGHESTINGMVLDMKKMSRDEANSAIDSLRNSRNGPLSRVNHFLQLIGQDEIKIDAEFSGVEDKIEKPKAKPKGNVEGDLTLTANETLEITHADAAADYHAISNGLAVAAAMTLILPWMAEEAAPMGVGISIRFGAPNIAEGIRGGSLIQEGRAAKSQHSSNAVARTNWLLRQYQDRVLQANSAGHELNAINAQIKTQEVRVKIVEKDIELQEKQIETAKATEEFLRSKYTNEALYSWQETQLRTLHYQTYIVAYDLAKKVEKSYHFERGLAGTDAQFIVGGWDDCRDGLLSAEALGLGLRRLESAYQESRGHDFEITKHISLRQIDPNALLKLRATNSCTFSLSQILFDMDFPGHHMRRLKSVSLSLPCVVGPYTSVNSTLQLAKHSYQLTATGDTTDKEVNYVPINSVAFSSGQNDPGVFELNFHDERYLPFEGAGAISTWDLSLPEFRAFDYNTISDVIMHLRYTSIAGGNNASQSMDKRGGKGDELYASFDLRNEFASGWQQLVSGGDMTLSNLKGRLPWWTTKYDMTVLSIHLLTSTTGNTFTASTKDEFVFQIKPDNGEAKKAKSGALIDGMMSFAIDNGIANFGTWGLTMATQTFDLADLWMVVQYTAEVM